MKKTTITKIAALALAVSACVGGVNVCAQNVNEDNAMTIAEQGIEPRYTGIATTYTYLKAVGSKTLSCQGSTSTRPGYTATVTVELQQNKGGWTTIKTWYDSASEYAVISDDYNVDTGYSYQLKVTHRSYKGGTLIDSDVSYSDVVSR